MQTHATILILMICHFYQIDAIARTDRFKQLKDHLNNILAMSQEVIEPVSELGHCLSAPNIFDTVADGLLEEKVARYFDKEIVSEDEYAIERCRHPSHRDNCRLIDFRDNHAKQIIFKHVDIDGLPSNPLLPLPSRISSVADYYRIENDYEGKAPKLRKDNLIDIFRIQSLKWLEESVDSNIEWLLEGSVKAPLALKGLLVDVKRQIDSMFECARTILSQTTERLNSLINAVIDPEIFDSKLAFKLEDLSDFISKSFCALYGEDVLEDEVQPELNLVSNFYSQIKPALSSCPALVTKQLKSCFTQHLEPLCRTLTKDFAAAEEEILVRAKHISDHFEQAIATCIEAKF